MTICAIFKSNLINGNNAWQVWACKSLSHSKCFNRPFLGWSNYAVNRYICRKKVITFIIQAIFYLNALKFHHSQKSKLSLSASIKHPINSKYMTILIFLSFFHDPNLFLPFFKNAFKSEFLVSDFSKAWLQCKFLKL